MIRLDPPTSALPRRGAHRARRGRGPARGGDPGHPTPHRRTNRESERSEPAMHDALTRYLYLAAVRDTDWVAAHFGHR